MKLKTLIPDSADLNFVKYLFEEAGGSTNIQIFDEKGDAIFTWAKPDVRQYMKKSI